MLYFVFVVYLVPYDFIKLGNKLQKDGKNPDAISVPLGGLDHRCRCVGSMRWSLPWEAFGRGGTDALNPSLNSSFLTSIYLIYTQHIVNTYTHTFAHTLGYRDITKHKAFFGPQAVYDEHNR